MEQLWGEVKGALRAAFPEPTFLNGWLLNITPLALTETDILLGVPDEFSATWIEEHYSDDIASVLRKISGKDLQLRFELGHAPTRTPEVVAPPPSPEPKKTGHSKSTAKPANCHSRNTFENFVVGDGNSFAYSAAVAVSQAPGKSFNPLFIYGTTGVGKTHLLHAIAHSASARHIVEFVTCEEFLNLYTEALKNNRLSDFRARFRKVDLLLIDDTQFLSKKTGLQEEFFNTFNSLHNQEKQIVLTSDRAPSEIDGLEARLVSRFENGLITDIQPLSFETRLAILKKLMENNPGRVDDEALYFVAEKVSSNVRNLRGALNKLTMYASLSNEKVNLSMARALLSYLPASNSESRMVSIEIIQKKVAEYFDLRLADLNGKKRPKNIATPRMIAMYLSRKMTDHSLPVIGEAFGGRGHATVLHAISRIEAEIAANKRMEQDIASIRRQLQNV